MQRRAASAAGAVLVGLLHPLDRKLLRDLVHLRGQVFAIALIVASGVGLLASSLAVVEALTETAEAFYDRYGFGDVFASARRAPRTLVPRIETIPGVQAVEARIVRTATLTLADFAEPVTGTLISLPSRSEPRLNRLAMRAGTLPAAGDATGVVLSEAFAEANSLQPGDRLQALVNGRQRTLTVTGIALSPEFVYAISPGALMPDPRRYGVLWLREDVLAAAYDLDGAFDDVVLTLAHGAETETVITRLDDLLAPYGGVGAVARADQASNWFLMNEIAQLRSMAGVLPAIFLTVAAFLANMVLARLVAIERAEIGLLKAFGYGSGAIAWHYAKLVLVITGLGVALGCAAGWGLGRWMTSLYAEIFRFPLLYYSPGPQPFVLAGAVSMAATLTGALSSARRAAQLAPAEAMRPPAPPAYRRAGALSDIARGWLDQLTRIVIRQLLRWPLRALLTSIGVAAAVALLVMAMQWIDAIRYMVESYFHGQQRQDVTVTLAEKQRESVLNDFARLPGVLAVEGQRTVAARLHHEQLSRRQGIIGLGAEAGLEVLRDAEGQRVRLPPEGLVLSSALAKRLRARPGDEIVVEVLEGERPVLRVPVAAVFETWMGTPAYMRLDALGRILGDPPLVNSVLARVDPSRLPALYRALEATPTVASVTARKAAVDNFNQSIAESLHVFIGIYVLFAGTLAVGVVYNSIRISLSERGRELATLRVLGFSSGEVSYVLLGEAALVVLMGLPLGCALGMGLIAFTTTSFETELFRIPPVVEASTFGIALLVILLAAVGCGLLVRRRLTRLDLIGVLKTRE